MKKLYTTRFFLFIFCLSSVMLLSSCGDDNKNESAPKLTISESLKSFAVDPEGLDAVIDFSAAASWTVEAKDVTESTPTTCSWIAFDKTSGIGGKINLKMFVRANSSDNQRTAAVTVTCGTSSEVISVVQAGSSLKFMDEADVKDLDKYWKPSEFRSMDMLRSDSKWSWFRSKQSEHFFVFWEPGFGDDPNDSSVPENLRVDIDDLLIKAEQFYKTNVEMLEFAEKGKGVSYLDDYKMQIYMIYQTEWLATGSGYDNKIGALWVNPSTCKPVGSTIAHEIGHSFQYQVYCDQLKNGEPETFQKGFRYGYEGSNGGNGFWEQCAQWQSFQDYPEQLFPNYHFAVWNANYHRHFCHEWMRYASYWMQYYWVQKHDITVVGEIWRKSVYPEDPLMTYMRLHCGNQLELLNAELYDYAARMATYDIDIIRDYADGYQGKYSTKFNTTDEGYYQVAYASCPGTTGFNVIPLNVPEAGTVVKTSFEGLAQGSALHANDPGQYMEGEVVVGTTKTYNNTATGSYAGWRYGFVAMKNTGERVYGEMNAMSKSDVEFTVPAGTEKLFFVVLGAPSKYKAHPWNEKEITNEQWPYMVKFENTDLLGSVTIDPSAQPQDIDIVYNVSFPASASDYLGTSVDLMSDGAVAKIAQAFVMQPTEISGSFLSTQAQPQEGKIAFASIQSDGSLNYTTTANGYGFWLDSNGDVIGWGSDNDSKVFAEFDSSSFVFSLGQFPGKSVAGDKYQMRIALIYTKGGVQYRATVTFNVTLS